MMIFIYICCTVLWACRTVLCVFDEEFIFSEKPNIQSKICVIVDGTIWAKFVDCCGDFFVVGKHLSFGRSIKESGWLKDGLILFRE